MRWTVCKSLDRQESRLKRVGMGGGGGIPYNRERMRDPD